MHTNPRLLAALVAASLFVSPALASNDSDTPTTKPAAAAPEKPAPAPPSEVTTQGTVDAAGQHIAYSAIAGTITVGATDAQDAQLGMDGKPEAGSQLALNEPKEPK